MRINYQKRVINLGDFLLKNVRVKNKPKLKADSHFINQNQKWERNRDHNICKLGSQKMLMDHELSRLFTITAGSLYLVFNTETNK